MEYITAKEYLKMSKKKKNKYNAQITLYNGRNYHSKFEANFARGLDLQMKSEDIRDRVETWVPQIPFDIIIGGIKVGTYYCDFKITYADGRIRYVDTKGVDTELSKLKRKCVSAQFKIKIEVVHKKVK